MHYFHVVFTFVFVNISYHRVGFLMVHLLILFYGFVPMTFSLYFIMTSFVIINNGEKK